LVEIFRGVVVAYHPESASYPSEILDLPINKQLEAHQKQVEEFILNKEKIDQSVNNLVAQVDASDEELHQWLINDDAASLWRWPN
jgi:hypothetical protein